MAYLGRRGALAPVSTADIPDNSITSAKIVDGAVAVADLGPNSVDSSELVDGSIDTSHIADDQVTGAKIENNPTIAGNLTVSGDLIPSEPLSNRNMIINGGMQIWQRGTSATAAGVNTYNTADRWMFAESADGGFTSERHSMSLAELNTTGHFYALKLVCTGVDSSVAAGAHSTFMQNIEAQNLQHLQYGTASAKTITLSFWVKSNKTGTYCVAIEKPDTTAYRIPIEYSISSADTWEQKKITITPTAGSTSLITSAAGVITNDTGIGLTVRFALVVGSTYHGTNNTWGTSNVLATSNQVNWQDSTSNNFYITGLQLEVGSSATPFEHRSYGDELIRCQRYFEKSWSQGTDIGTSTAVGAIIGGGSVGALTTSYLSAGISFAVEKRIAPTITLYDTAGNSGKVSADQPGTGTSTNQTGSTQNISTRTFGVLRSSGDNRSNLLCHYYAFADF